MLDLVESELLLGFVDESLDALSDVDSLLVTLENNHDDTEAIQAIFRVVHSLKGNAAFFGMMRIQKLSHRLEDLLDAVRNETIRISAEIVDVILPAIDLLKNTLITVRETEVEMIDETLLEDILDNISNVLTHSGHDYDNVLKQVHTLLDKLSDFVVSEGAST